jgi:hypothetical protein
MGMVLTEKKQQFRNREKEQSDRTQSFVPLSFKTKLEVQSLSGTTKLKLGSHISNKTESMGSINEIKTLQKIKNTPQSTFKKNARGPTISQGTRIHKTQKKTQPE